MDVLSLSAGMARGGQERGRGYQENIKQGRGHPALLIRFEQG
jgi:hypothetical protein